MARRASTLLLLLATAAAAATTAAAQQPATDDDNTFTRFLKLQETNMKSFFENQKQRVQRVIESGYDEASRMKDSVNTYVEQQQKKINADINKYIENMKDSGMKVMENFSDVTPDDPESRMAAPEAALSVPAILARAGYRCETHTVASRGYVLSVHRVPAAGRRAVLLQHGLFATSADWLLNGPNKALAYALADAGYDVWMSNVRGNRYSREHTYLKSDSKAYWNFSWHEVAQYDLPAIIDYIHEVKGPRAQIVYIGHSMGTTILFAMLSLRPEYNQKLTAGFALAPVVYMSDIKSPLKSIAPITSNVAYMEGLYGSHEFIPKKSSIGKIIGSCSADGMDFLVCKNIIFYIVGANEKQLNKTLLPTFLAHLGTGTSWKTAVHFAQEVLADGRFQQFDYGARRNMQVYGSATPPEYDLGAVSCRIKVFWAENDLLSGAADVARLQRALPAAELYKVPDPRFNHLDYIWAVDAPTLLNRKVLESLEEVFADSFIYGFNFKFKK